MRKKLIRNALLFAIGLSAGVASGALVVTTTNFVSNGLNDNSTLSLGTGIIASAGDMIVLSVASSKSYSNLWSVVSGDGGAVSAENGYWQDKNASVACYAVTNAGTFSISLDRSNSALSYDTAGAYVIHSTAVGGSVRLVAATGTYVAANISITNTIDYGTIGSNGVVIEAASVAGFVSYPAYTANVNPGNSRGTFLGSFTPGAISSTYVTTDITKNSRTAGLAFVEAVSFSAPALNAVTNLVTDATLDGLADIGETNTIRVVIGNSGTATATNVQTAVSIASNPSYFTIVTNSSPANLAPSEQLTNSFFVIATPSAAPGTYTFDVNTTADGGYSVSNTFDITVAASQPVLENTTNLVTDTSGNGKAIAGETNTVQILFRNTGVTTASNAVAGVSASAPAGYFVIITNSLPADLAGGAQATNTFVVLATTSAVPGSYTFNVDLSASNAAATNGSFAIVVEAAAPVLQNVTNIVTSTSILRGETNTVQVLAGNTGNIAATNLTVTVTAATNASYFSISPASSPANLAVGAVLTNSFTIHALTNAAVGTYSFNVQISSAGGFSTNGTFAFTVTAPPSGIWIASQSGLGWNVVSGTMSTSVYTGVSVKKGDVVVLSAGTNKKGSVIPLSPLVLGGTATVGAFAAMHNSLDTYPTAWSWYCPVTSDGTLDLGIKTDLNVGVTAQTACYVLRSDSLVINLAGSAIWDDNDNADNGTLYTLNYTFTNTLTDGVLIETVNTRTDLITEPVSYTEVINGADKRVMCSFDGITGNSWTSSYTIAGGTAAQQTSGALGLIFQRGAPVPPILINLTNLVTDATGDSRSFIGETNAVKIVVFNNGTLTATNMTVGVSTASNPSYFTIITNSAPTNLAWGAQTTNNFNVIANTNAAAGTYLFNVGITSAGGYSTNGTFSIIVTNGISVSGQNAQNAFQLLATGFGQSVTNSLMVISNKTFAPVICTFTDNQTWLTDVPPVTVAPRSATNVILVADSTGMSTFGAYSTALAVSYSQPVAVYTNFTVLFNVGAHVSVAGYAVTNEVNNGQLAGTYEPGDVIDLLVTNINDGGVAVSNLFSTLSANPMYFSIAPLAAGPYSQVLYGAVTTAAYRVTIATNTPEGNYAFTVTNTAVYGGQTLSWNDEDTILISVVYHADPSVSPSAVSLTVKSGMTNSSAVIVTNAGNAPVSFSVTDNAVWDTSYTVAQGTAGLVSTSGTSIITLLDPNPSNQFITAETEGISAVRPIGFSFPFYGTAYSNFYVTADGAIGLGNTTNTPPPGNGDGMLPDGGDILLIAPFWGSLYAPSNSVRYKLYADYLAITYSGVKQTSVFGGTNLQFQTLLYKTGAIEFRYGNINGSWLDAVSVGVQAGTNLYVNIDVTPASGTSVMLTRRINNWVTYAPAQGALAPFSSTSVVFTANAAGRQAGDSSAFAASFVWGSGGTGMVSVAANVISTLPGYSAVSSLSFTGTAGQVESALFMITNTGDAELTFTISDSAAATAGVSATNLSYEWIDISSIGTPVALADPDPNPFITAADEGTSAQLPIGFVFPFFGGSYTQFAVSANGIIRLDGETGRVQVLNTLASTDASMPAQMIAPYWGDLVIDSNATLKSHSDGTRLVVTWENVQQYGLLGGSNLTFQLVLRPSGEILFQYKQLEGRPWPRTLIGLRDTSARIFSADIRQPGDVTTNTYLYAGVVYTQYVNSVTNRTAAFRPAQIQIISVAPSSGSIPAGSNAQITVTGDASVLSGGTNSISTNAIFSITHNAAGSPASLAVTFTVTNSQEAVFAASASSADSDSDGLTDDMERIAGTDPQNSQSVLVVQTAAGRNLSWAAAEGRIYTIWYTVSLSEPFRILAEGVTGGSYTDTLNTTAPAVFYKISVSAP